MLYKNNKHNLEVRMLVRKKLSGVIMLLAVAAVSVAAAADIFKEKWLDTVPFEFYIQIGCVNDGSGEWLHVQGVGRYQGIFMTDFDDFRFSQYVVQATESATAIGQTTGQEYVMSYQDTFSFHNVNGVDSDEDQNRTWETHWLFVSKGADKNVELKRLNHFTYTPGGENPVAFGEIEVVCKG